MANSRLCRSSVCGTVTAREFCAIIVPNSGDLIYQEEEEGGGGGGGGNNNTLMIKGVSVLLNLAILR
jgi:hypothetical protein